MCSGGRTVVQQQPAPQLVNQPPKPVIYMRNQWLDGLGINAEERGRNSLRIDPGSATPTRPVRTGGPTPPTKVVTTGGNGGGLGIKGGGNFSGIKRKTGIRGFGSLI